MKSIHISSESGDAATSRRTGVTLVELIVAVSVMSLLLAAIVPLIHRVSIVNRTLDEKLLATRELGNLCERIALLGRQAPLTDEALAELQLSAYAREHLEQPQLQVTLKDADDDLPARQVTLAVSWLSSSGRRLSPLRLTTWVVTNDADEAEDEP